MAKALKCDICKEYYDPYYNLPAVLTNHVIENNDLHITLIDPLQRDGGNLDICPKCSKLILCVLRNQYPKREV